MTRSPAHELRVVCVADARAVLGESPVWVDDGTLLFVDIKRPAILAWRGGARLDVFPMPSPVSAIALRRNGGLIAAMQSGLAWVTLDPLSVEVFATPEADVPGNRMNDGRCDPAGRFWVASMDDAERSASGTLWRVDTELACARVGDVRCVVGNGIGFSPDGTTMYFTDSVARTISAFAFDVGSGALGERRVFATVVPDAGYPDGLCVDAEGGVWSAHWDGWRITRYAPDGSVDRVIRMPVPRPTSLTFGGPDLERLYVTSARIGVDTSAERSDAPSGGLFEVDVGVRGRPENRFGG